MDPTEASMRVKAFVRILVCLALLLNWGCATRGRAFDADSVVRIQPGRTTQEDIRNWFGEPMAIQTSGYGGMRWGYIHEHTTRRDTGTITKIGRSIASIFGHRVYVPPVDVAYENTERHKLTVLFRDDGVVEDYTYERRDIPTRRVY
jgi:outer membrane protein assembly factor BamE (lipoprotein component of BamABCDE complex)